MQNPPTESSPFLRAPSAIGHSPLEEWSRRLLAFSLVACACVGCWLALHVLSQLIEPAAEQLQGWVDRLQWGRWAAGR